MAEFESVLESGESGEYNGFLQIRLQCLGAISIFNKMYGLNQIHFGRHTLNHISALRCRMAEFESAMESGESGKCNGILGIRLRRLVAISILN